MSKDFASEHPVGFCRVPDNLEDVPALSLYGRNFVAPKTIDLRDYCTKTEDQGRKPMCAAYAAAQWAENVRWRITDAPEQIDPGWIYQYAKQHDGNPDGDGTTLTAVLEALLSRGIFDSKVCKIQVIRSSVEQLKYAIHKFGCALGGFMVTPEWYELNANNTTITGRDKRRIGGHAVMICGFNRDGVIFQNSWGCEWGADGFGLILWQAFYEQFLYGAVMTNILDGLRV